MAVRYGALPFAAQIAFFKQKLLLPTRGWTDVWQEEHDHAFVIAGATKRDMLADFQTAIQKAIEQGATLAQFRKDFDDIVAKYGWSYRGTRGWRSRVIYHTNIRTSYSAGRYKQLQRFPYWKYHHSVASKNARPQHLRWNGMILRREEPAWQWMYPPNGWGCNCYVTGVSEARMKAQGWQVSQSPDPKWREVEVGIHTPNPRTVKVPEGVSPGFAYAPGERAWMKPHILKPIKASARPSKYIPNIAAKDLMPPHQTFDKNLLLPQMKPGQEREYVNAFLAMFGASAEKPKLFVDATGEPIVIDAGLFKQGDTLKIGKGSRSREIVMLAQSIKDPDEIWVHMVWHNNEKDVFIERIYISRYIVGEKEYAAIVVMRYNDGWEGVTAHSTLSADEVSSKISRNRRGVRVYKRNGK